MLIPQIGDLVGTVSGGCLEGDLAKKAWWLTDAGAPVIRTYSTGVETDEADEEEALTFGLGCNGTVHILLERLKAGHQVIPVLLLRQVQFFGMPAVLATVISSSDRSVKLGDRLGIGPDGMLHKSLSHASLEPMLTGDLRTTLLLQRSALQRYETGDGKVEVLFEYLAPPRKLVVFGAGHDAQPLVRQARQQGWQVSVVDARSHFARRERFPEANQVLNLRIDQDHDMASLLTGAAVVVMSHSYSQDRHWLEVALRMKPAYIGQLGPRSRTDRLLDEIGAVSRDMEAFKQLHYPMGLDIGGDAPESVALSVLAEITAHFNGRNGHMLREREAPIHDSELVFRD